MAGNQLSSIQHVVHLMLENRSFDHMLGFLYSDSGNVSPAGQPFEGLTGQESNPDPAGAAVPVFKINPADPGCYFMPGADPGEGYANTHSQLFGTDRPPGKPGATNQGFVTNFDATIAYDQRAGRSVRAGTTPASIMGAFTPQALPILSGLARGFAVCDHWFASVPTETFPNRAFACAATSQGHMNDGCSSYTVRSIFGLLSEHNLAWKIYGYSQEPLTRKNFPDTTSAPDANFGTFATFTADAAAGQLPAYAFLEPSWGSSGNSQHPNYDVSLGERLIHDVYYALRSGPGWDQTLLFITYDEHGGCFDHVTPPVGAVAPDNSPGEFGFDFSRFGVRVPAVLVSPLIAAGTVYRVAAGSMPLDHTSVLKTVETRWGLPALTRRDAAAPDVGDVLTLSAPRADDPLAGVSVPSSSGPGPAVGEVSQIQKVDAQLTSQLPVPNEQLRGAPLLSTLRTPADYETYNSVRTAKWKAVRGPS
ncbi:MAG TPA: alkaline phosphatase family protein [Streptosporangiaceae bacterium]|nr:alkaline phosphatase family protein [Streptosporangiaceae bacterium]